MLTGVDPPLDGAVVLLEHVVQIEEKTRNGILRTPSVNPPRKQRMSLRQRSVTYVKSFSALSRGEEVPKTCFKFRYSEFLNIPSCRFVPIPGADEIKSVELLNSEYSWHPTWPQQ